MSEENAESGNQWTQVSAGIPASSQLRFVNCRKPQSVEELSATEKEQLLIAAKRYDGNDLPAEARLSPPDGEWDEEDSFYGFLSIWDVVDETETVRCTAWFYRVDSGTIFTHGTTDVVAEVIQCGIECIDANLTRQLNEAAAEIMVRDKEAAKDITIIPPQ